MAIGVLFLKNNILYPMGRAFIFGERFMAYYPGDWLDEVRARSDIIDIISAYVQLQPKGRRFWGLCPFHGEKTPSFSVDPDKQMYYCFGCHEGGNVFHFVMEMERLEFPEAVQLLAEKANMPIPQTTGKNTGPSREQKDRLHQALTHAARFYHGTLYTPGGEGALTYLHNRGLGDNTIRKFGIGATAEGWDNLLEVLTQEGFTREELADAGLIVRREEGGAYDVFRSRAMFPVFDSRGRMVAFGGRILGDGNPKYLNSSDTPVFNKRRTLYGLNFLKGMQERIFLVEGYMDVVSLYQNGITGCVATLGTAFTVEQARMLRRSAREVVIVYDGDSAGQKAIMRALEIFEGEGPINTDEFTVRVMVIPDGGDPDDYVRQYGGQAFYKLPMITATQYRLTAARVLQDLSTQEGRTRYAMDAAKILKELENPVEIENFVRQLVIDTGFSRDVLYEQIGKNVKTRSSVDISRNTTRKIRDTKTDQESDCVKAQQHLLSLMVAQEDIRELHAVTLDDFTDPLCQQMAQMILNESHAPFAASRLIDEIDDPQMRSKMTAILQMDADCDREQIPGMIKGYLHTIRLRRIEGRMDALKEQLQQAKPEELPALLLEYQELDGQLARIKAGRKE